MHPIILTCGAKHAEPAAKPAAACGKPAAQPAAQPAQPAAHHAQAPEELCAIANTVPVWVDNVGLVCADVGAVGAWLESGACSGGTSTLALATDGRLVCSSVL